MIDTKRLDLFMERAKVPIYEQPTIPGDEVILRCAKLVAEESQELVEAIGFKSGPGGLIRTHGMPCLRHVMKEAIDNLYVTIYTLRAFGFSHDLIKQAWELVCNNNDAKFGEGSTRRALDGKVIPPPGFVKEDLSSLII